ncbi:MAG: hypothetical protein ABI581_14055 [Sediminibacterium sp.]
MKMITIDSNISHLLFDRQSCVRFLCGIVDNYEFICPAPPIYYDVATLETAEVIDLLHAEYVPDFLIRHRRSGKAFLVDVLPGWCAKDPRLADRRMIAENFIHSKGYDWNYICVFEEEVILSGDALRSFENYLLLNSSEEREHWVLDFLFDLKFIKPACFRDREYSLLDYLIHGRFPDPK